MYLNYAAPTRADPCAICRNSLGIAWRFAAVRGGLLPCYESGVLDVALAAAVGVSQGMRHALEPDHVTALATVAVGSEKRSTRDTVRYAAAWGLGHGFVLVAFGGALIAAGTLLPDRIAAALELVVAVVLVGLGMRTLHSFALAFVSEDAGVRSPADTKAPRRPLSPLLLGCIHGCAGTGAVVAAALAMHATSRWASALGLALYGFGAALGMVLLAGVAGPALARVARQPRILRVVGIAAGLASVALGVAWGVRAALALT